MKLVFLIVSALSVDAGIWCYQRYQTEQRQVAEERARRQRRFEQRTQLEADELSLHTLELEAKTAELEGRPFDHSKIVTQLMLIDAERRVMKMEANLEETQAQK